MELEFYRHMPLFQNMGAPEIREVIDNIKMTKKTYQKGETIFTQGQCINAFGVVLSGIIKGVNYDMMGHANVISRMSQGDIFGESYAYSMDVPMVVAIEVIKDCEVLFFDVASIKALNNKNLNANLITILSSKNIYLTRKLNAITPKSIRERILSYLTSQQDLHGSSSFDIPFNRQELADYLLVDRSSLSHELSLMQKEGLITFKKNHFTIVLESLKD